MARAKTTPELAEGASAPAATSEAVTINGQAGESSSAPPESGLSPGTGEVDDTQNLSTDETSADTHELTEGPEGGSADQLLSSPNLLTPEAPSPIAEDASTDGISAVLPAEIDETVPANLTATTDTAETALANPNPAIVQIYPMRSYMDENELRRRGGPAYSAPRRHAQDLVQRKLASFEPLKE